MTLYVTVAMEEGITQKVEIFFSRESALKCEAAWLRETGLEVEADREHASDWGTGFAIWEVQLQP